MTCCEARSVRIEQIEIKNYRVFRNIRLTGLRPMTVVIGANGSGKSTLFDVFSFLKDALSGNVASVERTPMSSASCRCWPVCSDCPIPVRCGPLCCGGDHR